MENLSIVNNMTIDSREVTEMLGIEHWQLLRKLEGSESAKVIGIIPTLADNGIVVSDYFISSTYKDGSGKENKCYNFTKMGCEFIANKFTGEKGILFTAKYVEKFNKMEQTLIQPKSNLDILKLEFKVIEEHEQKIKSIEQDITDIKENSPLYNIECKELQELVRKVGTKSLGGYKTPAYKNNSLRSKVYADIQQQLKREFGVKKYEAIKRCQLIKAKEIVQKYAPPLILTSEIKLENNQIQFN